RPRTMNTAAKASASITNPASGLATTLTAARDQAWAWMQQHLALLIVLAVLVAAVVTGVLRSRRAARRRWYAGARLVTVLPPAGLDPAAATAGARRLWWDLPSLAPPPWKRLLTGLPHLTVEYHLTAGDDLAVR